MKLSSRMALAMVVLVALTALAVGLLSYHSVRSAVLPRAAERAEEMLMMGLRLAEGVGRAHFRSETGTEIEASLDRGRLADLVAGGFLVQDAEGLRATAAGRQRLNAVLAALAA